MINRARAIRSSASGGALFQALPAAISQVISPGGVMNEAWYRFFQMIWLKNSSGISNDVTLASVADAAETAQLAADAAQTTATNAANAVTAETNARIAADDNLQTQITNNNNALNARFGSVNSFGSTAAGAGAQAGWINVTINGTAYVMPVYNT